MKILLLADSNSIHTSGQLACIRDSEVELGLFSFHGETEQAIRLSAKNGGLQLFLGAGLAGNTAISKVPSHLARLKKCIKAFSPDIIHAHYASSYGLLAMLSGRPYVVNLWGSDVFEFPKRSFLHRAVFKRILASSKAIVSTSKVMKTEVRKYTSAPVEVIPFGVDLNRFTVSDKKNKEALVIGTIKALDRIYGIDVLIDSFSRLSAALPEKDLSLVIAGEGPEEHNLKSQVKELGLTDQVTFLGRVAHAQVPEVLADLDVFVALSREESFGVAIIEAMSCGLAVLVSEAPGPKEIVQHGVNGQLVPIDDINAATSALIDLISSPTKRKALGAEARKKVEHEYSKKAMKSSLRALYSRLSK